MSLGSEIVTGRSRIRSLLFIFYILMSFTVSYAQESEGSTTLSFNEISDFEKLENPNLDYTHVIRARGNGKDGIWTIYVTLLHNDTGWNHYADRWQVLDSSTGDILGDRILMHPHETEQPFTRSLSGIRIDKSIEQITIRGACQVHGFGGTEMIIDL